MPTCPPALGAVFALFCVVLCLVCSAPPCLAATPVRVGEAAVRLNPAGLPCFTITEAEERRNGTPAFQSISVSDVATGVKGAMWTMAMPSARTFPVSYRMCIPYAGRLPVLPQTPAGELDPGRVYEVSIQMRKPLTPAAPRSYRAYFCLRSPRAAARLQLLAPDPKGRLACLP